MASLITSFYKIGNLLYIIILILVLVESQLDTSQAYYLVVPLVLNFVAHGVKNFQLYRNKIQQDANSKIQTQVVHKLSYGQKSCFQNIKQEKVEIGDIILLKKDEICTSDILVIASKESNIIVETAEIDGNREYRLIKSVNSTNEDNITIQTILKSYKYTLNGKIEYYPILRESKIFEGYIKLESDPKGEKEVAIFVILTGKMDKNSYSYLVFQLTYLSFMNGYQNINRILGIVIDYGYLNTVLSVKQVKIARDKYLLKFLNRFIQMTTVWISFALFSVIFWKNIRQTFKTVTNNSNKDQYVLILESIIVYSQGVPVLLYALFHGSYYIIKYQIERKYKQKNKEVKINNSGALTNLSHVDIAVFSLTGAFLHPEQRDFLTGVYIGNKFYSAFHNEINGIPPFRQSLKILQEDELIDSPSPINKLQQIQMMQGMVHNFSQPIQPVQDQNKKIASNQSLPQLGTNLLKINDLGKQQEESNNMEYNSEDDDDDSKSKSNIRSKQRSEVKSTFSKSSTRNQVKKRETCELVNDEIDEMNHRNATDGDSIYEHINLNSLKESLPWNNKNKFQSGVSLQSPVNKCQSMKMNSNTIQQIHSNTNLCNTSIQNISIQNQSISQNYAQLNTLIHNTLASSKAYQTNGISFQFPNNSGQQQLLNGNESHFYINQKNIPPSSNSMDDSQKHDNASEHADAVPNLHFNTDPLTRPNGQLTNHSNSPVIGEESQKMKSVQDNVSGTKMETNNHYHNESQNQFYSSINLEKMNQPRSIAINLEQLDLDNHSPINKKSDTHNGDEGNNNSSLNFTKNFNTIQLNGQDPDYELKHPLELIPEMNENKKNKKKSTMKMLNSDSKRVENNQSHKGSISSNFNNQNNSDDTQHINGSYQNHNRNGRLNNTILDIQTTLKNPRRKASSHIPIVDSSENTMTVNQSAQKVGNPLIIKIPHRDSGLVINRNPNSVNGSGLKTLGNNVQSPSPTNINKSFFGSILPRQNRATSSNQNHNRSFNIFTSPNQFIQTTLNNPTHQSFQHHKSIAHFQPGEIIKWSEFSLHPPYPMTKPPKFDDRNKLNDLIAIVDNPSTSLKEYISNIDFFKALALCHCTKTKKIQEKSIDEEIEDANDNNDNKQNQQTESNIKYKFEPFSKDDISQLQLSQKLGMEFLRGGIFRHKQFYDVKYREKTIRYEVKDTFLPNETRQFFCIIVKVDDKHLSNLIPPTNLSQFNNAKKNISHNQNPNQSAINQFVECESKELQLFIKGTAQEILPRCQLSKFQKDLILKDLQSQQIRGMRQIFFAKKIIKDSDLKTGIDELANSMDFVGSMCLMQQLIPETQQLVHLFQSAGILNWLISSDSQNTILAAAYQSQMIQHDTTLLVLDQANVEELKYQIKNHLFFLQSLILEEEEMNFQPESGNKVKEGQSVRSITKEQYKRRMSNLNNSRKGSSYITAGSDQEKLDKIALIVDGSIFQIILSNDYLKSHFQFLCLVSNSVLGYHFGASSKAQLVQLIQQTRNSKTTVISFGYGSKDSQFMNQSNFSFMIKGQSTCQSYIGDVTLKDFSLVRDLIFEDSIEVSDKLQYLVVTNTKLIIFIMFINYFYQLHNYQIQSDLVKGYQITLNIYASQTIASIYILLCSFAQNPQNCLVKLRPEFYRFRKVQNSWMKSHFLDCMLFAAIYGFLTSLLLENTVMSYYSIDGKLIDYEIAQGIISFVMGFILIFIVMAGPMQHKPLKAVIFIVIQTIISILPSVFKVVEEDTSQPYIFGDLFTLDQAFIIVFLMGSVFITEYFFTKFFRHSLVPEQFYEVFNIHGIRFNPERVKTFLEKLRSTVHEVRLSQQFLTDILKELFTKTEIDPFLRKILDPAQKVDGTQDMHKLSLQFNDKRIEKTYREYRIEIFSEKFSIIIALITVSFMSASIIDAIVGLDDYDTISEGMYIIHSFLIYSRILIQFITVCFCIAISIKKSEILIINPKKLVNVVYYYLIPFGVINTALYSILKGKEIDIINNAFLISILNWDSVPPPLALSYSVCIADTISAIASIMNSSKFGQNGSTKNQLLCSIAYLIYVFHNFTYFYLQERARRNIFSTKNRIKYEESEVDHVLANLLPPFVRARFNSSGNASIEEDQGEVAILFLDICDFDSILLEEQTKLIKWIDNLYRQFDKICVEYGVQKIETVGKIYMACAGLKLSKEEKLRQQKMLGDNETKRLLLAAQEMQIKAKQYFWGINLQTDVKIGIHYGKVIAGVIGAHKPQFSLIGDTVNTASRVCSNCKKSRITLSLEAHQRLGKTEWLFIEREVEAKGKGILKIYSLAENIRNTIIKVNNDLNGKKNSLNTNKFQSKNDGLHSKNNLNNVSMHSQNMSIHSNSMRSFRNSIDNGIQQQTSSAQVIQYTQQPPLITNISRKNTVQRNLVKKNKTFVSSTDLNNELGELVGNEEVNSSFQAKNVNNESGKFQQGSSNSVSSNQAVKRKLKYSMTMLIQPRNSLQNTLAVQKLDTLEINEEECDPETKIYQEEEKREHTLARKDTITFQNQKKPDKDQSSQQEPMLKVSRFLLSYLNGKDDIVRKFELGNSTESSQQSGQRSQIVQFCIHVLVIIIVFINLDLLSTKEQILLLILKAIECAISIFAILFLPKIASKVQLHKIALHFYTIFSHINSIVLSIYFQNNEGILNIIFIEHISTLNMIQNFSFAHFNSTFFHAFTLIALWMYIYYEINFFYGMVKICIFIIFEIYKCYVRWDVKIQNFNNLVAHEIKKSEKDNLIKYLVPKHILTQFLQNKKQYKEISETLEKVTLLFADIAGFTSYSSNKHPSEVVKMLRNLFTSFDQLCLKHKVYKVYTIGDCYVVLGVVDKYNRSYHDECKNVVEMGFSMIQVIENIKREHEDFKNVNMRIGIHLGEKILGGIIGTNIVRYDIFGKDVVIANKMESNGQLGRINVSEDTKKFLDNHFPNEYKFEDNKEVELNNFKQDGQSLKVKSYFIEQGDYNPKTQTED